MQMPPPTRDFYHAELNYAKPRLFLVVPCYNEEPIVHIFTKALDAKLRALISAKKIDKKSKIIFVNDGSADRTLELLRRHKTQRMSILSLSKNCGHQNALLAGLSYAKNKCDCTVSLDCDLQDDIHLIDKMVERFAHKFEVVYGVRSERREDSAFKRTTALGFYNLMRILGAKIVKNHADYRLLSARAIAALLEFREVNLFLRGIVPQLGFKSCELFYKRTSRVGGESKYPLRKMLSFAIDGITSFSVQPLRILVATGFLVCLGSILVALWTLVEHFLGRTISGWSSLLITMCFLGGVQILSIGVLGEYIGKIYKETKARPRYFIESVWE